MTDNKRKIETQILHICNDGEREDVQEKVSLGWVYCHICGKKFVENRPPLLEVNHD